MADKLIPSSVFKVTRSDWGDRLSLGLPPVAVSPGLGVRVENIASRERRRAASEAARLGSYSDERQGSETE
jgi:hypothetical protein